jgi:hypothetical protein
MTTAKPPARYSAMESARSGDFTTPELHHPSGRNPPTTPRPAWVRLGPAHDTVCQIKF